MTPYAEPLTERLFDHVLFSSHTKVRLTDGHEYPIEAVDFERRQVKYYNGKDVPYWIDRDKVAAIV
ncbi:hypothetical protein BHU16_08235 [Tannerella sp. oral taxon 808]|nr:hypothetical protein BHU16_08235 [Tannerella sp. oral taxon 808]